MHTVIGGVGVSRPTALTPRSRTVTRQLLRAWTDNCHRNSIEGGRRSLSRASLEASSGCSGLFRPFFGGNDEQGSRSNCPSGSFWVRHWERKVVAGWALTGPTGTPVKMTAVSVARARFHSLLPD